MEKMEKATFVIEIETDKILSDKTRKEIVDRLESFAADEIADDILKRLRLLIKITIGVVKKAS